LAAASSLTTLATALLATTKAQEQWVTARAVQNDLYSERFLFEQVAGPYGDKALTQEARLKLFAERLMHVATGGHQAWAKTTRDRAQ
jgi:hypothetical protein